MVDSGHFMKSSSTGKDVKPSDDEDAATVRNSIEDHKVKRAKDLEDLFSNPFVALKWRDIYVPSALAYRDFSPNARSHLTHGEHHPHSTFKNQLFHQYGSD